jgi:hypothetical protein
MSFLETLPLAKILAVMGLLLIVIMVVRTLWNRDKCDESRISFDDLLLDADGRMSKSAIVMFGSFGMTTWLMVFLALSDKMSEGYLTIYGGLWIIPSVTKLIKGVPAVNQPPVNPP